jgi:hypothetical protein
MTIAQRVRKFQHFFGVEDGGVGHVGFWKNSVFHAVD